MVIKKKMVHWVQMKFRHFYKELLIMKDCYPIKKFSVVKKLVAFPKNMSLLLLFIMTAF